MIQKDLVLDFNLCLCERFGYQNSIHSIDTQNGFCACVREKEVKLYIRFWEYSNGMNGFPDWCIILVHCNFTKKQEQVLQEIVQFFKEYAPRYKYGHIGIEDNSRLSQLLGFQHIQSAKGKENYITKLVMD